MDRIVVSPLDIANASESVTDQHFASRPASASISWWVRLLVCTTAVVLPAACLLSLIVRVVIRGAEARARFAWFALVNSVLMASGLVTSIGFVLLLASSSGRPVLLSDGLEELDSRVSFPSGITSDVVSAEDVAARFKPLVTVVSPAQHRWFPTVDSPSATLGAGIVLDADREGYLIATARHVVDGDPVTSKTERALVASTNGTWSSANVVARHLTKDIVLLWLPRVSGTGSFTLPIAKLDEVKDGSTIFLIGHPQGLRFTLSTGIVSRKDGDTIQTTAPVSPGSSGGPMLDSHGRLTGIVTSMVDRNRSPNAESLNFAVRADALLDNSGWSFSGSGRKYLEEFQHGQPMQKSNGKVK